jgi:hypothetical protein
LLFLYRWHDLRLESLVKSEDDCSMYDLDKSNRLLRLEEFSHFCSSLDISAVIAAAGERGQANGYEKEVYAIAILRAVQNGDFGSDRNAVQEAISALWARGCHSGFNVHSFNTVFQDFFTRW